MKTIINTRGLFVIIQFLLFAVAPHISGAQRMSVQELKELNEKLSGNLSDTARVQMFLKLSGHNVEDVDRVTARDSSINFARHAQELSKKIGYDSGLVKGYLAEILVWVRKGESELRKGDAGKIDAKSSFLNAKPIQMQLIEYAHERGSPDEIGETYSSIAQLYNRSGTDHSVLLPLYDSAASYFRRSGNRIRESETLYFVGFSMFATTHPKDAIPIFHRSIAIVQPEGRPKLFRVYGILGLTFNYLGSYSLALKYQLQALKLAEAEKDTSYMTGGIHLFLGGTYRRLNNLELAEMHYEKAYEIYQHSIDLNPNDFTAAVFNKAGFLIQKDPKAGIAFVEEFAKKYPKLAERPLAKTYVSRAYMEAYTYLKDYKTANKYCDQLITQLVAVSPSFQQTTYLEIGQYYIKTGQFERAKKILPVIREINYQNTNVFLQRLNLYWSKIDSADGNFRSAFERYKLSRAYGDSVLNEAKAKEIAAFEIEYETQKKEQSIALLTKDSELKTQKLMQYRLTRNATFGGLAVLLIILGLVGNQYRIKAAGNKKLLSQQMEINQKNKSLKNLVEEKEWLLKEVHHRVKNNLQIVMSLLESQSAHLQSEALIAMQTSQNRIYAMSLIHQKLYQTENVGSIEMNSYLRELIGNLKECFDSKHLYFDLQFAAIYLDVSKAVAIGLIVNEAITNSIKYAFPDCRQGTIAVLMETGDDEQIMLTVSDNGIGFSPDLINAKKGHFGLKLMKGLTEDIAGQFSIESGPGTKITIEFVSSANLINSPAFAHSNDYI